MKTFNFPRYKALVAYSLVENKKTYLLACGILVALFLIFVLPNSPAKLMLNGYSAYYPSAHQNTLDVVTTWAAVAFVVVMSFVVTQVELVSRYCSAREGTRYCMLPATPLEKACAILTVFLLFEVVGSFLYYLIVYGIMFLEYTYCDIDVAFRPFPFPDNKITNFFFNTVSLEEILEMKNSEKAFYRFDAWLTIRMLPLTWLMYKLYSLVIVSYFRSKALLKGLLAQKVFEAIVLWVIGMTIVVLSQIDPEGVLRTFINSLVSPYLPLAVVLLQIPITALFAWWLVRRLRNKEIR